MSRPVKRSYDASGRRARAAASRERIMAAAVDLFVSRGYGQTSLKQVAQAAGVSVETIYATYGNKAALLRRAWYFAARGDDEDITLYDRADMQAILAEPHLAERLRLYAAFATAFSRRMSPLIVMLEGAAASEPAAADLLAEWAGRRMEVARRFASASAETGQLAVTRADCRDVMFATLHGDLWRQLVGQRGWSDERYASWLGSLWVSQFVA